MLEFYHCAINNIHVTNVHAGDTNQTKGCIVASLVNRSTNKHKSCKGNRPVNITVQTTDM